MAPAEFFTTNPVQWEQAQKWTIQISQSQKKQEPVAPVSVQSKKPTSACELLRFWLMLYHISHWLRVVSTSGQSLELD